MDQRGLFLMKKFLLIFIVVGAIIASIAVFVGIKHNPMGEFCIGNDIDNCRIDWIYASQLWFFWFTPVFLIQTVILFAVKFMISWSKKLTSASTGRQGPRRP